VEPDAFRGSEALLLRLRAGARRYYLLSYFRFITLTTVGYWDLTPAAETSQGLVVLEAITGQFFLAVLLAELLGERAAQMLSDPRPATQAGTTRRRDPAP
jgi:hypothetical protein